MGIFLLLDFYVCAPEYYKDLQVHYYIGVCRNEKLMPQRNVGRQF